MCHRTADVNSFNDVIMFSMRRVYYAFRGQNNIIVNICYKTTYLFVTKANYSLIKYICSVVAKIDGVIKRRRIFTTLNPRYD